MSAARKEDDMKKALLTLKKSFEESGIREPVPGKDKLLEPPAPESSADKHGSDAPLPPPPKPPEKEFALDIEPPKKKSASEKPERKQKSRRKPKEKKARTRSKASPEPEQKDLSGQYRFLRSEVDKLFEEVLKNKEKMQEIHALAKEIKAIKGEIDANMASVNAIRNELEQFKATIESGLKKQDDFRKNVLTDIESLKKDVQALGNRETEIESLDIKGIKRDLEALKEKSAWIEEKLESIKLNDVMNMIAELENKIENLRISSPLIIE